MMWGRWLSGRWSSGRWSSGLLAVGMGVLVGGGMLPPTPCGPPAPRATAVPVVLEPADPLVFDPASPLPTALDGPWSRWADDRSGPDRTGTGRTGTDRIVARPIAGWSSDACAPTTALDWEVAGVTRARPADVLHGLPHAERLHSPLDDGGTGQW